MKDAGLRVRVERELRDEFVKTCQLQGFRASDVLREFMRSYVVREHSGMQTSLWPNQQSTAAKARAL